MALSVSTSALRRAAVALGGLLRSRQLGQLIGIEFTAQGAWLSAVGASASARVLVSGTNSKPGGTCFVRGDRLADLVRALPGDDVALSATRQGLRVVGDMVEATLTAQEAPSATFLATDAPPVGDGRVSLRALAGAVGRVAFAAREVDSAPILAGIHVVVHKGTLRLEATDRHVMSATRVAVDATTPECDLVVTAKALGLLGDVFLSDETIDLRPLSESLEFQSANGALRLARLEGAFPPLRDVLRRVPQDRCVDLALDAAREHVRTVATIFDPRSTEMRPVLAMRIGDGCVALHTLNRECGGVDSELSATVRGAPLEIHVNANYLRAILAAVPGSQVRLRLSDACGPIYFEGEGEEAPGGWRGVLAATRAA